MVISSTGTVLRTPVSTVSVQGRPAGGVQFMALRPGERVACVALLNGNGDVGGEETD
jgi:DNA gyrase/topoisomerase IV subunit A